MNHKAHGGTRKDLFVRFVVHLPRSSSTLLFSSVLLVAAALRFAGLDWDGGHLVHPDERRMLMVVEKLHWPQPAGWQELLSPASPLNPRFFAYGSFPLYLLRLLGALVGSDPARLYLPGRVLSATFGLLTVAALYAIGRELGGRRVGLLASALLACAVLAIQLAHYLTVDSLLTLLATLAVWCWLRVAHSGSLRPGLLAGALTGLALATKTSALPLLCAGWAAWALVALGGAGVPRLRRGLAGLLASGAAAGLAFVAAEPYAAIDWFRFGMGVAQEWAMASGAVDLPYTRQFAGTPAYLYQLRELATWSLGLPLGLLGLVGLAWLTWWVVGRSGLGRLRAVAMRDRLSRFALCRCRLLRGNPPWGSAGGERSGRPGWRQGFAPCPHDPRPAGAATTKADAIGHLVILAWVWPYLLATGSLHAKFSRYMAPLVPWLCLAAALLLWQLWERAGARRWARWAVAGMGGAVLAATFAYALAFTSIYLRPHPWLAAGDWIRRNVPEGAVLTTEVWDDRLPVAGPGDPATPAYRYVELDMWAIEGEAGLEALADALSQADYVVLASQRLYGAIGRLPERYPRAFAYYQALFAGQLGFRLAHVEASYPLLGRLAIVDEPFDGTWLPRPALPQPAPLVLSFGRADESYSVYDHPRVLIFRKAERLPPEEIEARIRRAAGGSPGEAGRRP